MALDFAHDTCRRTTSTLNEAVNDTGRTAFCGPIVVSAVAGVPVSEVEAAINASRGLDPARRRQVVGTYAEDVEGALAAFGYDLSPVDTFLHLERKERPTLWSWMQKPRSAWAHYLLGIHKGREGHWVLIKGVKLCDTFTDGRWTFVCDGPHRGARIMEVFAIRKSLHV